MAMNNISSSYLLSSMTSSISNAQSTLASDGVELSTGQYADIGLQLGAESGYELSLKSELEQLQTLTSSNGVVSTNLTTAQDVLGTLVSGAPASSGSILANAQSVETDLVTWMSSSTDENTTLQSMGSTALQSLIASANTSSAGTYVFGGENSGTPPMDNYYSTPPSAAQTAVQSAFQSALSSAGASTASDLSSSDLQSFLSGPFADLFSMSGSPSNWSTYFSNASSTNTTAEVAPGMTVSASTNINQSGFQQLTEGYTMLAEFGNAGLSSSAQQTLATQALSLITQGVSSITSQAANVGSALTQVTNASSSMSSQMTILQTQVGNLDNVNTTEVATQLTQLSTQLETAYQLTSQIQKLSLAQYLPV